jgi:hypothetical protein
MAVPNTFRQYQVDERAPIWIHRPPALTGVPVSIFSPIFADFKLWCDTIAIDAKDLSVAHSFMLAMSEFHVSEEDHRLIGKRILGVWSSMGFTDYISGLFGTDGNNDWEVYARLRSDGNIGPKRRPRRHRRVQE